MSRATSAVIHIDALRHNLALLRGRAPDARVMAVVKADGYGHGLERVARALAGADAFGVAALSDAERLRAVGLSQRIILLSGFDDAADLPLLRRLDVDTVVHHEFQLALLEAAGSWPGTALRVWLKIDSGMHRLGFPAESARSAWQRLRGLPWVDPDIVLMTHLAGSDEFDGEATRDQLRRFAAATDGLPGRRSLANSAGVLGWPAAHADWIRPGGALYGLSAVAGATGESLGLQPAMSLETRLIAVNQVPAGECIGYGGIHRCQHETRVGIAAIGYGDGYPRHAVGGTPVLVGGRRTRILGRVSMDLLAIDLDLLPEATVGAPVRLWGPGLPIEEVAAAAGTLGYELACGITRRVRFVESEDPLA